MKLNLYCRFNQTGIGRHAENFYRALHHVPGRNFAISHTDAEDKTAIVQMLVEQQNDDVTIFFVMQNPQFLNMVKGRKILWLAFETDNIPSKWREHLGHYDAIWVPSVWGRDILIKCGIPAEKIRVIPEGVDAATYCPAPVAHAGFVFLSVGKYEKRKGISELIQAYSEEFPRGNYPDTFLWLKADFPMFPQLIEELKTQTGFDNRIKILDGDRSEAEMVALYNSADAFMFPSRAEGFGLPCIEAIACGAPVAATFYSGQTEYLHEIEGLYVPIAYDIEPIDDFLYDHFYKEIYAGEPYGKWARPGISSIRQAMRQIYENRDAWKEKAARASTIIREKFDWSKAAQKAVDELNRHSRESGNPARATAST